MRICQLSSVESAFGFLVPLFDALDRDGHEVVAASIMDHDGDVLRHHLGTAHELHRIGVSRKVTARALTTEIVALARYLRRERFDVVHLHGPLASIQGRLAARLAAVPCVINHVHGFYFHEGMARPSRVVHQTAERLLNRHLADHVVTVNSEDLEHARRNGFARDPARIVATPGVGIDTERFAPGSARRHAVRRELGVPDGELLVVFVGRLVAEKGVQELLTAFSELLAEQPAWLVLVGDVSPSERDQSVLARIEQEHRRDPEAAARTLLLGQRRDVPDLLAAADLVVQPSYREGMPVSVLEAMSAGVPLVTTDIRGSREAVAGGAAGVLVSPRDAAALSTAVRKLAADPEERARLGAAGRARVEDHYATSIAVAPLVALYRRIEASNTGRPRSARARLRSTARRVVPPALSGPATRLPPWRIAVERTTDPLSPVGRDRHPVFSEEELDRLGITMVADPFAIERDGTWHLFFEQVRRGEARGEIGLATSDDLADWRYRGVVLSEDFHLSYPHVLADGDDIVMIPETSLDGTVRLYRAMGTPHAWELDRILLQGKPYKDSTVLLHDGRYYLFTESSVSHTHDRLDLFVAPSVRGPWRPHPSNPIVLDDAGAARPAGRVVEVDGRLVRLTQSCEQVYGAGVRARPILTLSPLEYRESPDEIQLHPSGRSDGTGHHADIHRIPGGWLRFVDVHG
ncbi:MULTISPECIES: glucosamine inositolphosphorylceramide transferase family protein [unclassified Pseudonocardia]|uniref:glucosamine inositolphosphorylceramide transferase family protein n=1 Tax=unclassified Pseudonocardia TaxID=2619320 RepID=UPI000AF4D624|nr:MULTISPECIES: glycosyltransferase [unclassified Pseudonocardia]